MKMRILMLPVFMLVLSPMVWAQDYRMEITPFASYTFSSGIDFSPRDIEGVSVNEITPKSGAAWGLQVDVLGGENFALGFQFSDQFSTLELGISGGEKRDLTDMNVRNYHGIFTVIAGDENEEVRPFFFGGLGATQYSADDFMGNSIEGLTKFSSTWGGGVKFFPGEHLGLRFTARWTPTYINSSSGGLWCSPYWPGGCWIVEDPNFAHQFDLNAGLIFRF